MKQEEDRQGKIKEAMALHQEGKIREAIEIYEAVLPYEESNSQLLYLLGTAYYQIHRLNDAESFLKKSVELDPSQAGAHSNRGLTFEALGKLGEALECFDHALSINPKFSGAHSNRGGLLKQMGRLDEALLSYDAALEVNPKYAEAHYNKGLVFQDLDKLEAAVNAYDAALAINPGYAEALSNRGNALRGLNRLDEALSSYDAALRINPNFAEATWNKSYILLLQGRYLDGWRLYEWRRRLTLIQNAFRPQGNPLLPDTVITDNPIIFIYSEQGLGDAIQFCRYAKLLAKEEAQILLQVPKTLQGLMTSLDPNITFVNSEKGLPQFDYQTSLMSLPWIFQTTLETVPSEPSYLSAPEHARNAWSEKLGAKMKPRVGLVWAGGSDHTNDQRRSIPLEQLISILNPSFEWHSIQRDYRERDPEILKGHPEILQHQDLIQDFADTAALVEQMDLIISVDTSVAHLAGALGKPVWILLPYVPDFRWLMNREDSPWYPSARLYRQDERMSWDTVIDRVKQDLAHALIK